MKRWVILSFIVFFVSVGFVFKDNFYNAYFKIFGDLSKIERGVSQIIKEAEKQIFLPPPLRVQEDYESSLSKNQVIAWTNAERKKQGLASLQESEKLNLSAEMKARDMILGQYFEHESPAGERVSDLAQKIDYEYIVLGENLAMGNFKDDKALVQAWMDSQGHRENILNPNYLEIGVSVIKGIFEGRAVWMAVQHFALPLGVCPEADETIKAEIEINERKIERIQNMLNLLKNELRTRQDIKEYNELVSENNQLIEKNKILVSEYNRQVKNFNECLLKSTK